MRILIDMDGVVCQFVEHWCELANRYYDTDLKPANITEWEMHKCTGGQISKQEAEDLIWTAGFFRHLLPVTGAIWHIKQLTKEPDNHEIVFVTACKAGHEDKLAWLAAHLPDVEYKVVFTDAKYLIQGDVFIDDNADNIRKWADANPTGVAITYAAPYNVGGLNRQATWHEVLQRIKSVTLFGIGGSAYSELCGKSRKLEIENEELKIALRGIKSNVTKEVDRIVK